jgi:chromosome segregation ATPase
MSGPASEPFGTHPFGEIVRAALAAQEQGLELARSWSESLQQLVRDQAEDGRTALEALASAMAAMERALESQEETNRALRESLEAYREVIERASATQERSARLIQTALDGFASTSRAQLELTKALLVPLGAQPASVGNLFQVWNDAFQQLLEAAPRPRRDRRDQGST